jgi:spore maturation protein CgeB
MKKWSHLRLKLDLERTPDTMRSYVRKAEYFDVMLKSKVCLNLRGAAENGKTLRFYEIPYVGSHMLSQDSGAEQVHPFLHGVHCTYFRNEDELDRMIEQLMEVPTYTHIIAANGHEHAMKFHTVDARMQQMYEVLDGPR